MQKAPMDYSKTIIYKIACNEPNPQPQEKNKLINEYEIKAVC